METLPQRLVLNVGGRRFEVARSTVAAHPDSMLARMFRGDAPLARADSDGSYFFDRDSDAFALVLNYMRTRRCAVPDGMEDHVRDEFTYWGFDGDALLPRVGIENDLGARLREARDSLARRSDNSSAIQELLDRYDDDEAWQVDRLLALFMRTRLPLIERHARGNYFSEVYVAMHKRIPAEPHRNSRTTRAVFANAVTTTRYYETWLAETRAAALAYKQAAATIAATDALQAEVERLAPSRAIVDEFLARVCREASHKLMAFSGEANDPTEVVFKPDTPEASKLASAVANAVDDVQRFLEMYTRGEKEDDTDAIENMLWLWVRGTHTKHYVHLVNEQSERRERIARPSVLFASARARLLWSRALEARGLVTTWQRGTFDARASRALLDGARCRCPIVLINDCTHTCVDAEKHTSNVRDADDLLALQEQRDACADLVDVYDTLHNLCNGGHFRARDRIIWLCKISWRAPVEPRAAKRARA